MKKKIIVNGLLTVVVLGLVVFLVASISNFLSSQRRYVRPADHIVPGDQVLYDEIVGPAKLPPAANMVFLRSLEPVEFTAEKIRFEFDEKAAQEPVESSEVGYSVEYLDLDNLDMSAGYVRPLALGVAGPYVPEKGTLQPGKDRDAESMPYKYYDLKGNLLAQDLFDAKEEVRTERWLGPGSMDLQIVFEMQNLETPRHVNSFLCNRSRYKEVRSKKERL